MCKLGGSFVVWTNTNYMNFAIQSDNTFGRKFQMVFLLMRLSENNSKHIAWFWLSVTSCNIIPNAPDQWAPVKVRNCHVFEQIKAAENIGPRRKHWLISQWGDSSIQAKLLDMYCNQCRCLSQLYDVTQYTCWKMLPRWCCCYSNLSIEGYNVTQSGQSQAQFENLHRTVSTLCPQNGILEENSNSNQICLQSEQSLSNKGCRWSDWGSLHDLNQDTLLLISNHERDNWDAAGVTWC